MMEIILIWFWMFGFSKTLDVFDRKNKFAEYSPSFYVKVFTTWPYLLIRRAIAVLLHKHSTTKGTKTMNKILILTTAIILSACQTTMRDPSLTPGIWLEAPGIYSTSELVTFHGSMTSRAVKQCQHVGGDLEVITTIQKYGVFTTDPYNKMLFRCNKKQ